MEKLLSKINLADLPVEKGLDYAVYEKYRSEHLSVDEFKSWGFLESLDLIHSESLDISVFKIEKEVKNLFKELNEKTKYQKFIFEIDGFDEKFSEIYEDLCLCHLDLNNKNIFKEENYKYIDFEFSKMSSRYIDISLMLSHLDVTSQELKNLYKLCKYNEKEVSLIEALAMPSNLYWALWCEKNEKSKDWAQYYLDKLK